MLLNLLVFLNLAFLPNTFAWSPKRSGNSYINILLFENIILTSKLKLNRKHTRKITLESVVEYLTRRKIMCRKVIDFDTKFSLKIPIPLSFLCCEIETTPEMNVMTGIMGNIMEECKDEIKTNQNGNSPVCLRNNCLHPINYNLQTLKIEEK